MSLATHPDAVAALDDAEADVWQRHYAPPPVLSLSEWADRYRIISPPAPEPGPWRTDRAPYLREPMDCVSDPHESTVVLMWGSQLGKTEIIHNTIGYYAHQDPTGVLVVRPSVDEGKAWSKERLAPMFRDTQVLRDILKDPRSRDSGNTILIKQFTGGWLAIVGANAPSGLASRPARVLIADEWDRFEQSAGTEGDPIKLAEVRQRNFWNRKRLYVSSPGLKDFSKIARAYEKGDQRQYLVACPHCEHEQRLNFWRPKTDEPKGFLYWEERQPETAAYCCGGCGALIEERYKGRMQGRWVATNPDGLYPSFSLSALNSPWMSWESVVREWYDAQGNPQELKVFVNTVLAETWEEKAGAGTTPQGILARREAWETEIPEGVQLLTAGVDVQDNRIEAVIVGWGQGWESWRVSRETLIGDPTKVEVWQQLDELWGKAWTGPNGSTWHIHAGCIDSGFLSQEVYSWTKPRFHRQIYATKGSSEPSAPLVGARPTMNNRLRAPVFMVGTKAGKDVVYSRLKILDRGPGYMHMAEWVDEDYAAQVTAEKIAKRLHRGRQVAMYELPPGRRNEMLDCEVLAYVATQIIRWRPVALVEQPAADAGADEAQPDDYTHQRVEALYTPPPRRGFVQRWR